MYLYHDIVAADLLLRLEIHIIVEVYRCHDVLAIRRQIDLIKERHPAFGLDGFHRIGRVTYYLIECHAFAQFNLYGVHRLKDADYWEREVIGNRNVCLTICLRRHKSLPLYRLGCGCSAVVYFNEPNGV